MCKSIILSAGRKIRRYSARFFTFLLIFVMLFSNTAQVWAATTSLYSYPNDTSVVGDSTINNASLMGVYLSNMSNSDYSSSSGNYTASKELKAGIPNNASYSARQYNGADGNGVDLLPNFQIAFNKNIPGNSTNKGLVTLVKVNADATESSVATNVTLNDSLNSSLFVSPTAKLEPSTSYKVKVSSGIMADQTPVTLTNNTYEILFKTKASTPSLAKTDVLSGTDNKLNSNTTKTKTLTDLQPADTTPPNVEGDVSITGVTLDKTNATIAVGAKAQLTAAVAPTDATNKSVTWESSDTAIATVDANGQVTAVSIGSANITVTTSNGAFTAICDVTVNAIASTIAATSITLDKTSATIAAGDTAQLTATVAPTDATNKSVTWSSSNTAIATVDANGKVTAGAIGSADIIVTTATGGFTASCAVTVHAIVPATGVTLDKTSATIAAGTTAQLTAMVTPTDATNKSVTWASSDTAIATVDANGKVTAVAIGSANITATTANMGFTAICAVTVTAVAPTIAATGITLDNASATIAAGATAQLTATVAPTDTTNKSVTWASSDMAIATVDANGLVTAVATGSANITVTTANMGFTASCAVTVQAIAPTIAATGVTLDKASATIVAGATAQLTAKVAPTDTTNKSVTWASSDTAIATVDANGKVTAVATGSANITVTTANMELTAICAVTVNAVATTIATASNTVFSADDPAPNLTVGDNFTMTATLTATNGGAYGFEGGFKVTEVSPYGGSIVPNPSFLQLDKAKFAADNAGIQGIMVDTTTKIGYVYVYVESDGQTLKIPQGVTTIKFPFKVVNTRAAATTPLALTDVYDATCRWTLLTNPLTRVRATGSGLATLNFDGDKIDAALGLGYAVYDASSHNLDGLTIAFAAKAAFTLDKTQATVGDVVTATATINSSVDAYGFTGALVFTAANLTLDTNATAAANPALPLTFTGNNGANRITCLSNSKVITANTPLALVLKFKVTNSTTYNLTVNFSGYPSRMLLFKDHTVQASDVATTAQITTQEALGTIAIAPSTVSPVLTTIQSATVTLAPDGTDSGKIGDTLAVKATINSTVDAYGFTGLFSYPYNSSIPHGQITPDVTATQAANSAISGLTVSTSNDDFSSYVCFNYDPVGQTKVITAGKPITLILKFKVVGTAATTMTSLAVNVSKLVLFTDSSVTGASLYNSDITTFNNNIRSAEAAGKAAIAYLSGSAVNLHTLFNAGVVFDTPTANVGGNEQPVTVTAKITGPADKDVYGFETTIAYQGNNNFATDLQLDPAATIAANAGILAGKVVVGGTPVQGDRRYAVSLWVESDGVTPIIKKGETLDLKLVFKILPFDIESTLTVNTGTTNGKMVLFTDPSIRAKTTGSGLTTINFDPNNIVISTQEAAGTIAVAGATGGSITLTRALTGLTMSTYDFNTYNAYDLATPADVLAFADAVNTLGYTAINATIKNDIDMTGTAFAGIGTKDHPFVGTISGGQLNYKTITIARVVTDGSSAVGGLVNYLGSAGKIERIATAGTITGDFGGASVGGIVGVSTGVNFTPPTSSSVSISGAATNGANIGGIAGSLNCSIANNWGYINYTGNISVMAAQGSTVNVGGIVGTFDGTGQTADSNRTIALCSNTGNISGGTNTGSIVGSIKNGIINQSGNGGFTEAGKPWSGGGIVSGDGNTGGVAGQATDTTFNNVANTGAVNGSGGSIGGIVGTIYGTGTSVLQSYNTTTVTGSGASVGGIAGENASADSTIKANYNFDNVTATGSKPNAGTIVGKATATPAGYTSNYYIKNGSVNSGIGDALDNTVFTADSGNENANSVSNPASFSLTGVSNEAPGIYSYNSQPPLTDTNGTYLLSTVGDILWFYQTVNNNTTFDTKNKINGRLVNDIDMSKVPSAQFSGIGKGIDGAVFNHYAGTFDGAGKTVTVKNSSLFNVCDGATIRNLTIDGSRRGFGIGGIVNGIANGIIENCHNKADINSTDDPTISDSGNNGDSGGIAAGATNTTISGCTNSGNITAGDLGGIGGIVGNIGGSFSDGLESHSVLSNCVNSGNITGGRTVGGIAGSTDGMNSTLDFISCINTGKVTSTAMTSSGHTGIYNPVYTESAGGILGGALDMNINIESCQNSGEVTGTANNLGGLVGVSGPSMSYDYDTYIKITNSTNSGKVISTVDPNAVDTSYNGIPSPINPDYIYVGGIMGNATAGLKGLDISGNTNTGVVDKGIATNANGILGSNGQNGFSVDPSTNTDVQTGGNTPPVVDPSGGNTPPVVDPTGGNTPPVVDPTGGNTPPVVDPTGGNTPPVVDPTGGNTPPVVNPSGGNNPTGNNNQTGNSNPIVVNSSVAGTPGSNTLATKSTTLVAANSPNTRSITNKSVTASNPEPVQTNAVKKPVPVKDASNTSGKSTAVSEKVTKPVSKSATIYEVVQETIQNNPIIVIVLFLFIVILAGMGGFRRYRKSREQ